MVNTLEIACLSSAAALAYLVYKANSGPPMLPVEVNGETVFAPKALFDIMADLSEFSVGYNNAISRISEGPRLPDDQYALVLQADGKWQGVRDGFDALYDRVTATCAKGGEVEDDLPSFREQQKARIHEIQGLLGDHLTPTCD